MEPVGVTRRRRKEEEEEEEEEATAEERRVGRRRRSEVEAIFLKVCGLVPVLVLVLACARVASDDDTVCGYLLHLVSRKW
jgi:hypothetical protein